MSSEPLVRRIDADGVAIIELNRPDRRNALIGPLFEQLADHVNAANATAGINAIVLCGAGGAFCSGLDLKEFNADPAPSWLPDAPALLRSAHEALARCDAPIVVALERFAINGGAAFALAGDLIVAGETAWLQVGEVQMGMAAPNNLAWLTARYPLSTVLQVTLPGHRILGPELARMNIAHEVVADESVRTRAEALASEIASFPAGAGRMMKKAVLEMGASDENS